MSMLERVRERVFYLPTRMQARVLGALTALVVAGGLVLDHVLTGLANTILWAVMIFLLGVTVGLGLVARRR